MLRVELEPIRQRASSDFVDLLVNMDGSIDLWFHQPVTTADNKLPGPPADGFIFRAHSTSFPSRFAPALHPFSWEGYPEKKQYPWSAEHHLYLVGNSTWLIVSIWCGPEANRELVQEMLTATSKSVEKTRKMMDR